MEQPSLGVEPGAAGVGADAHLGTALGQPVKGATVGSAEIHGAEHPQFTACLQVGAEHGLEQPQATPLDEGAEQVDPIGRRDFGLQCLPHAGFAGGIDQQGPVDQGDQGPGDGDLAGE